MFGVSSLPFVILAILLSLGSSKDFQDIPRIHSPLKNVVSPRCFSLFDETIDKFDVYKVETIGDAYMVVSGLPSRNGIRHAEEVGLMSLELLAQIEFFKPPHDPFSSVALRIGMHSGENCVYDV